MHYPRSVHFWALSKALDGEARLESFLKWSDQPLIKFAEWGLVILLALHLGFGLRLLIVEFGPARKLYNDLVTASAIGALVTGVVFVIRIF